MTKTRKEMAIAALKEQIKMHKEKLSDSELKEMQEIAQKIMKGERNIPAPNSKLPKGSIPYDKDSAMQALKLYIQNSDDPEETERRILEILKNNQPTRH